MTMRAFRLDGGGLLLPESMSVFRRLSTALAHRIAERRRRRAAAVALSQLNDHLLRDIGLTRADVMSARDLG
jgi:uncharacterized protein YjiS (DUF1127 family)